VKTLSDKTVGPIRYKDGVDLEKKNWITIVMKYLEGES
jgi:hypothetical protein